MLKRIILALVKRFTKEYTHIKTGNKYYYLFTANEFSGRAGFPKMAVYMSVDGTFYARPKDEFDEKFAYTVITIDIGSGDKQ